jgi:hypothetical protein
MIGMVVEAAITSAGRPEALVLRSSGAPGLKVPSRMLRRTSFDSGP